MVYWQTRRIENNQQIKGIHLTLAFLLLFFYLIHRQIQMESIKLNYTDTCHHTGHWKLRCWGRGFTPSPWNFYEPIINCKVKVFWKGSDFNVRTSSPPPFFWGGGGLVSWQASPLGSGDLIELCIIKTLYKQTNNQYLIFFIHIHRQIEMESKKVNYTDTCHHINGLLTNLEDGRSKIKLNHIKLSIIKTAKT